MDMDIDAPDPNNAPDPNELYRSAINKFGPDINRQANDDDDMLNFVLFKLARVVPGHTFDIDFATIQALRMNDLRDFLKLGNYDYVAREVLRRCIAGETLRCIALRNDHIWSIEKQKPAPSLPNTTGGRE
jgi:hypothetical protein